MIYEYEFIVTVEVNPKDREEEKELVKKFKRELYKLFPSGKKISVEGIKRR